MIERINTERAYILDDKEPAYDGSIVGHVYRLGIDSRRRTDYYVCGSKRTAKNLVTALTREPS